MKHDNAYVGIEPEDRFPAYVDPDTERWNGFVIPHFTLDTARHLARTLNERNLTTAIRTGDTYGSDAITIDEDDQTITIHSGAYYHDEDYEPIVHTPDHDGRYSIGGHHWTWTITGTFDQARITPPPRADVLLDDLADRFPSGTLTDQATQDATPAHRNLIRARHAYTTLTAYRDSTGSYHGDPATAHMSDLLADLHHLCDALDINIDKPLAKAAQQHHAETHGEG